MRLRLKNLITSIATLLLICSLTALNSGCGASGPPLTIPAPTGGYITVTATNASGLSLVYGYIIVSDVPIPDVEVVVTNETLNIIETTTADSTAFFSVDIESSLGDVISVQYQDPVTGLLSNPTTFTVDSSTQQIPGTGMTAFDVDVDSDSGLAYIVTNDGTDSQIVVIDLSTGVINQTAMFSSVLFDKIAVHSTLNFAAILDTSAASNGLKWCDLANLAAGCTSYDPLEAPIDVAVVDVAAAPITTDDLVIVTYNYNSTSFSFGSMYPIPSATPSILGAENFMCIVNPADAGYPTAPVSCGGTTSPKPTGATLVSLIADSSNRPFMSVVADYDNGETVTHFFRIRDVAGSLFLSTLAPYGSGVLAAGTTPFALKWYNETNALLTDSANGLLIEVQYVGTTTLTTQNLSVGADPRGIYPDLANSRAFVDIQSTDKVLGINMTTFQLDGNSYFTNFNPTELVYFGSGATQSVGTILTFPSPLFTTVDVTP